MPTDTEGAVSKPDPEPVQTAPKPRRWLKRVLVAVLIVIVGLIAIVIAGLTYFNIPSNTAGLAAQTVCSGTFVGGRDPQAVYTEDVVPQSPALKLVSTSANSANKTVTAKFMGIVSRTAAYANDRGCVLDIAPDPNAKAYVSPPNKPGEWPAGDQAVPQSQWPSGVNAEGMDQLVGSVFEGAGDPNSQNARAFAVVQNGKLLTQKVAPGFGETAPQLGWSMTKTVNMMLFYKKAKEVGLDLNTKVVDAFPPGKAPSWISSWQADSQKKNVTVADLVFMRSGLDNADDYGPTGKVVQMLYDEPSMADFAASQNAIHQPGTVWAYSTGTSDMISQLAQARFPNDQAYWQYPTQALYQPLGVTSGMMTTDTSGTWVGGSYQWGNVTDWARMGQMMLDDGKWNGQQILPAGWWQLAGTPAMPTGDGHGYGAQTWKPGDPVGGECKNEGVPPDTLTMEGHYGQLVAMIPSYNAVIVRLGWTINADNFDGCKLITDTIKNLPKAK